MRQGFFNKLFHQINSPVFVDVEMEKLLPLPISCSLERTISRILSRILLANLMNTLLQFKMSSLETQEELFDGSLRAKEDFIRQVGKDNH